MTPPPISDSHTITPSDPIILLNLSKSTKLNPTNYLSWQSQITPILHGHDLYKYFIAHPLTPTITTDDGQPQLNPHYLT
jgi:hypothetical protein